MAGRYPGGAMHSLSIGRILLGLAARRRVAALTAAVVVATGGSVAVATTAQSAGNRIDLRALVVDDGSPWAHAVSDQFTLEGVPFTTITLSDPARPIITASFLASGTEAFFDAVVVPGDQGTALPAAEQSALSTYEAQFGVREVDGYDGASPAVGLNWAQNPGYIGDLTGMTATVTPAAQAAGFGYLSGTVPIGIGSYGYLATPAGTGVMPAGG